MRKMMMVLIAALATAGCASMSTSTWSAHPTRPAENTPPQFVTEDRTLPTSGCRNPVIDPRDNTRLRLMRSAHVGTQHMGDYEVSGGRYGVRPGELLRIDCGTGEPIGIVTG